MLSTFLFTLITFALVPVFALQLPFGSDRHRKDEDQVIFDTWGLTEWNIDELPNPNDTGHLVFETVYSLLQHWPNTRMRNGHNIVPAIIPRGTLLYHGVLNAHHDALPTSPDWVATDPEHSHIFCVDQFNWFSRQKCKLFTLATTRSLKVVYFDGTSAATMSTGTADTQQLIAWGRPSSGSWKEELQLVQDLCKWGKGFDINGFVRMEMDLSSCAILPLASAWFPLRVFLVEGLFGPGNVDSVAGFVTYEAVEAGSWHNHLPGETRIQLDFAGLVSFYDTELVPSLVSARVGQERWDHRARNISNDDLSAVKSRLEAVLTRPPGSGSGIGWKTLIQVITDRFAGRLELTRHLLHSARRPGELLDLAHKTQAHLRVMLAPYLLASATPSSPLDETDLDWTLPIYKLCSTTHTSHLVSYLNSMTSSENLLFKAIQSTNREICRVVTKMWAAGIYVGIDSVLNTKEHPDIAKVAHIWNTWREDLDHLMAWLDWSVWVKCNPHCGIEEMCYLPTFPIGFPGRETSPFPDKVHPEKMTNLDLRYMVRNMLAEEMREIVKPEPDEWIRPQPKCIRRIPPHEF